MLLHWPLRASLRGAFLFLLASFAESKASESKASESSASSFLAVQQTSPLSLVSPHSTFRQEALLWKKKERTLSKSFMRLDKHGVFHGHVQDPKLQWDWGFRSGIQYEDFGHDWHFVATHAHFHSRSFASLQREGKAFPLWEDPNSPQMIRLQGSSSSSWRLDFEIADLEVGKSFALKEFLAIRPHVGLRSAWMYQRFEIDAETSSSQGNTEIQPLWNNCLAFGARSGMDTLWSLGLGKRLKLFGDGAVSWLSGYHNIHQRQSFVQMKDSLEEMRPSLGIALAEFSLGLQYEKRLDLQGALFRLRLGYEFNYFFNQAQFMNWLNPFSQGVSKQTLSLEGLTLGLHLDF